MSLPAADIFIRHRFPLISITRPDDLLAAEPGVLIVAYWNGTRATNTDAIAGFTNAIDYDNPLFGPTAFYPFPPGVGDPANGWGRGGWGQGPWGRGISVFKWQSNFAWRDGTYQIEFYLQDQYGNRTVDPVAAKNLRVEAVGRPADSLRVDGWNDPALSLQWEHSGEFEAAS